MVWGDTPYHISVDTMGVFTLYAQTVLQGILGHYGV